MDAQGIDKALLSVSYDTADACSSFTLRGLQTLVDPSQIHFGSNFPFNPEATVASSIETLKASGCLN